MLTSFVSCGDSKSTSEESELSESNVTEETTEPETRKINPLLDKKITCDYLSFCVPSEWEHDINEYDDYTSIFLFCEDEDYSIMFFIDDISLEDALYDEYSNHEISKTFTSYGQEYSIIDEANKDTKKLIFSNDRIKGIMSYPVDYEDIVMDMIDSIEFDDNISDSSADDVSENSVELDSDWECDYLKIGTYSDWKEDSQMNGKSFTVIWNWEDSDVYHFISLMLDESSMGRMSQSDLQEFYEEYFEYSSNENNYKIIDNFMEDKQAYIVIGNEELPLWNIHFSTDTVQGDFTYTSQDEDIVRNMIETIEFY